MRKTQELKESVAEAEIAVNYPQERECVVSPDYTFRIEAKGATRVELSIDDSDWQPCRRADGYWWYDWSGYMSGKHEAIARIQPQNDGQQFASQTRRFRVELPRAH